MGGLTAPLALCLCVSLLPPAAADFTGCPGFDVGSTYAGKDVVKDGLGGQKFADDVWASWNQTANVLYVESAPPRNFTVTIQAFHNGGACSPRVFPASGEASLFPASVEVTTAYNCTAEAGRTQVIVTWYPGGDCEGRSVQVAWWKTVGTALMVATKPSLLTQPDIAANGKTLPTWRLPHVVYGPEVEWVEFFMALGGDSGPEPLRSIDLVADSKGLSLSPGPYTSPFTSGGPHLAFNVSFDCHGSVDGASVTVTPAMLPFRQTSFQFFKQCAPIPHLTVQLATTGNIALADGIPGYLWRQNPTFQYNVGTLVTLHENTSPFSIFLTSGFQTNGYEMAPLVISAVPVYNPVNGTNTAANYTLSGSFKGGVVDGTVRQFVLTYHCGDVSGLTLFSATLQATNLVLGANGPVATPNVTFYWLKACGHAAGLDVSAVSGTSDAVPAMVVKDGQPVAPYLASSPVQLPASVDRVMLYYRQAPPYPAFTMAGALVPTWTGYAIPTFSGPLVDGGGAPVVTGVPTPVYVDFWVKDRQVPNIPLAIAVPNHLSAFTSFTFEFKTFANPRQNVYIYQVEDTKNPIVANSIPNAGWSYYAPYARTYVRSCTPPSPGVGSFVAKFTPGTAHDTGVTFGRPVLRSSIAACSPTMDISGHSDFPSNFSLALTPSAPVSFTVNFNCTPHSGTALVQVVLPVLDDPQGSGYTVTKFQLQYNSDVNVPQLPAVPRHCTAVRHQAEPAMGILSCVAPESKCSPLEHFVVELAPLCASPPCVNSNVTVTVPATTANASVSFNVPLPNASLAYDFRVAALNSVGRGPWTSWGSTAVPPSPPPSPSPQPSQPSATPSPGVSPTPAADDSKQTYGTMMLVGIAVSVAAFVLALLLFCLGKTQGSQDDPLREVSLQAGGASPSRPVARVTSSKSKASRSSRRSKGSKRSRGRRRKEHQPLLPPDEEAGAGAPLSASALFDPTTVWSNPAPETSRPVDIVAPVSNMSMPPQPDSDGFVQHVAGLTPVQRAPIGDMPSDSDSV